MLTGNRTNNIHHKYNIQKLCKLEDTELVTLKCSKEKKFFELRIFLFRKTILAREMAWQIKVLITKLVNLSSFPKTQW